MDSVESPRKLDAWGFAPWIRPIRCLGVFAGGSRGDVARPSRSPAVGSRRACGTAAAGWRTRATSLPVWIKRCNVSQLAAYRPGVEGDSRGVPRGPARQLRPLYATACYAGLRRGELRGLK